MENIMLQKAIDEVQEMKNAIVDLDNRIHDPKGAFATLESAGILIGYCRRDTISLNIHLTQVLANARRVLQAWIDSADV